MADQAPIQAQRVITLKTGERVILDPGVTTQNIMLVSCLRIKFITDLNRFLFSQIYYWSINVGAFLKLGTTCMYPKIYLKTLKIPNCNVADAEKRIGFWLAYLVPLIVYLLMPLFLVATYKSLIKLPPQGSVVFDTFKVGKTLVARRGVKAVFKGGDELWDSAKPVSS